MRRCVHNPWTPWKAGCCTQQPQLLLLPGLLIACMASLPTTPVAHLHPKAADERLHCLLQGYFRLHRDIPDPDGTCGIATTASYPIKTSPNPPPPPPVPQQCDWCAECTMAAAMPSNLPPALAMHALYGTSIHICCDALLCTSSCACTNLPLVREDRRSARSVCAPKSNV